MIDDGHLAAGRARRSSSGTRPCSTRSSASGRARSAEASRLMAGLVSRGLRTICFAKSRKAAELIHRFTAERVDAATAARLAPYRAGYTPAQRREIERRLSRASCSASPRPTRSSSGSTSASSTARSRSASPARSPRCASSGAGPGAAGTGSRCSWRARTRSTSSSCASPRRCSSGGSRRPDPRPRELPDPRPARLRGRLRGAARRGGRGHARPRGARAGGAAARARANARGLRLEGARHPAARVLAPLGRPGLLHDRRRHDRLRPRPRRARARLLDRPRGRRLPPSRRAVPRPGARRRDPHGASSSPPASTGTRR